MGDSDEGLGALVVHSKKYADLQKQNLIEFVEHSDAKTQIATYQGKRLIKDDGMPMIFRPVSFNLAGCWCDWLWFWSAGQCSNCSYKDEEANGGG